VLPDENPTPQADDEAALDAAIGDLDWSVLPAGVVTSRLEAPSGSLATASLGDPAHPPVVLVPGVTGSKEDFGLMLPILAAAGYRVRSYDQAGQYESAAAGPGGLRPPRRRYDYDLFVDDLIAVLEAEGAGAPVHVLGYSFAGTVAQLALVRRPELFASLALLSCPPEPGQAFRGVKRIGWISWLATGPVGAALMMWGIRRNFVPAPPGRLRFVRDRLRVTNRASVGDIIGMMKRAPDLRDALARIDIPKLIAVGEHDLWPLRLHFAFADRIRAHVAVYRSGHSPCETSPHQLSRDLLELYSRSTAPAG
jgi:pimeloyl-ACP methyl ester carboxylesterase